MERLHGLTPLEIVRSFPRSTRLSGAILGAGIFLLTQQTPTGEDIRTCAVERSGIQSVPSRQTTDAINTEMQATEKIADRSTELDEYRDLLAQSQSKAIDMQNRFDQAFSQCAAEIDPNSLRGLKLVGYLALLASLGFLAETADPGVITLPIRNSFRR